MRILIIDEDYARHNAFTQHLEGIHILFHLYSVSEAIDCLRISKNPFDLILIDHSIGIKDGLWFASWIGKDLTKEQYPKRIIVQSRNPVGARILSELQSIGIQCEQRIYTPDLPAELADELCPSIFSQDQYRALVKMIGSAAHHAEVNPIQFIEDCLKSYKEVS